MTDELSRAETERSAEVDQPSVRLRAVMRESVHYLAKRAVDRGLDADHVTGRSVSIHQPSTSNHLSETVSLALDADGLLNWYWSWGESIGRASDPESVIEKIAKVVCVPNATAAACDPTSKATRGVSWADRTSGPEILYHAAGDVA